MSKRDIEKVNRDLPSTINLKTLVVLLKMQLQLFTRRVACKAKRVEKVKAKRPPAITPRLAVVSVSTVTLFASFALQMEILSVGSACAIWFAMQETEAERKARVAEDLAEQHAQVYSEELARQMARKEAQQRHQQDDLSARHFRARRSESNSDSVTYH